MPERAAGAESSYDVLPQQALLYRLCGDRNPLSEVTGLLLDGGPSRVGGFSARFAGVVFPGDTIRVRAWDEGERIILSTTVDDRPVLADCLLRRA